MSCQVHHGQCDDHRYFEVDDLRAEQEITFEVAGVHEQNDHVGANGGVLIQEDLVGNPFVGAFWVEAVGPGQVDDIDGKAGGQFAYAGFFIYGYAGEIAYFLVKAGQRIEKRAFPAIGVAHQRDMEIMLFQSGVASSYTRGQRYNVGPIGAYEMRRNVFIRC